MNVKKAIILAGGSGTRLFPISQAVNKHLLPIYDKPMIYYPLSILMLAGIREFLLIVNPGDEIRFRAILGGGERFGISINYAEQSKPRGIADAFLVGEQFIGNDPVLLILGDNIFHGTGLVEKLTSALIVDKGAHVFLYEVDDASAFGVAEVDGAGKVLSIEEKPQVPKSKLAVTGLYVYDNSVVEKSKSLEASDRGELEITAINNLYLNEERLNYSVLGRGTAWLDTGTKDDLLDAAIYIRAIEKRQGLQIASPEEIAFTRDWADKNTILEPLKLYKYTEYYKYIADL